MQICVIAGSGYDCDWELRVTSFDSVEAYCPQTNIQYTHADGCADFAERKLIVHRTHMSEDDYYGMNVLWHEIRHATLYSECIIWNPSFGNITI